MTSQISSFRNQVSQLKTKAEAAEKVAATAATNAANKAADITENGLRSAVKAAEAAKTAADDALTALKNDVINKATTIKSDLTGFQSNVKNITTDIWEDKQEVAGLILTFEAYSTAIFDVANTVIESLSNDLSTLVNLDRLESSIDSCDNTSYTTHLNCIISNLSKVCTNHIPPSMGRTLDLTILSTIATFSNGVPTALWDKVSKLVNLSFLGNLDIHLSNYAISLDTKETDELAKQTLIAYLTGLKTYILVKKATFSLSVDGNLATF